MRHKVRKTSRRQKNTASQNTKSKMITALVPVDQKKIRKKYIQGCKRTIKELDKAKIEWNQYHSSDIPEFEKWYNQEFGKSLTEKRELHEKAQELYQLIADTHFWKRRKQCSWKRAYEYAIDCKQNPEKYEKELEKERREREKYYEEEERRERERRESFSSDPEFDEEDELTDDEISFLFDAFLEDNPSIKKQIKNEDMYDFFFQRFRESFRGNESLSEEDGQDSKSETNENKVKSVYRELARKLHPDFNKDQSDFNRELWYEVQEAYRNNDFEKLETLLAISNIQNGNFTEEFSISQILNVQYEYKLQLKSIRSQIRKAKKTKEWGFSKLNDKRKLKTSLSQEMKMLKNNIKKDINDFQYTINLIKLNKYPSYR